MFDHTFKQNKIGLNQNTNNFVIHFYTIYIKLMKIQSTFFNVYNNHKSYVSNIYRNHITKSQLKHL